MQKITTGARLLLGLMFTVFGLDGLLRAITGNGLFPMPTEMSPEMTTVMTGIVGMKYLIPLAKFIEFVAGIFFLSGRFVDLGIIILTPVIVNIVGINLFVDRSGAPMAIVIAVLLLLVIQSRWNNFKHLFNVK